MKPSLTPEEREIAAARAETYPPNRGDFFFAVAVEPGARGAAAHLRKHPDAWESG